MSADAQMDAVSIIVSVININTNNQCERTFNLNVHTHVFIVQALPHHIMYSPCHAHSQKILHQMHLGPAACLALPAPGQFYTDLQYPETPEDERYTTVTLGVVVISETVLS